MIGWNGRKSEEEKSEEGIMSRRKCLSKSLDTGIHGGFGGSQVLLFSAVDEFRRTAEDETVKEGGSFMEGRVSA